MRNPRILQFQVLAATVVCSCVTTQAATVLGSDDFTNSSGTAASSINNTQATGVGTWQSIQGSTSTVLSVVATGPTYGDFGSGNILQNSNSSANTLYRAFNPEVSPFTINSLATGTTLRLSFDFRIGGGTMSNGDNFGFGFVYKGAGTVGDTVLYANVDTYTTTGTAGLISEFRYRAGSYNFGGSSTQIGAAWNETSTFATGGIYSFQLDVTKLSDGGVLLEYYRDDALTGSFTAVGGSTYITNMGGVDITGIGIRQAESTGVVYYFDNVSVSIIPEPSTGLLAMGLGAGLLFVRKRATSRHRVSA